MNSNNLADRMQTINLHALASVTADGLSAAQDLVDYEGDLLLVIEVSNPVAGTNPTMDCALHHADTSGGSYSAVSGTAITQVTTTGSVTSVALNRNDLKRFVKLNKDIGGTSSPEYYVSAKIFGLKKYA